MRPAFAYAVPRPTHGAGASRVIVDSHRVAATSAAPIRVRRPARPALPARPPAPRGGAAARVRAPVQAPPHPEPLRLREGRAGLLLLRVELEGPLEAPRGE